MVAPIVFVAIGSVVLLVLTLIYIFFATGYVLCFRTSKYEREKQRILEAQNKVVPVTGNARIDLLIHKMSDFNVAYSELEFGDLLGKGSQGEVYLAQWRGTTIAVKKVDTSNVEPTTVEEFCQEASMMRHMHHYSLTQFLGISFQSNALCILTEYVERGSLFDIIQDTKSTYTWQRGIDVLTDVARGMNYLHSSKPCILHRDLKSLNILVTRDWRGKIADFGMTRFQDPDAGIVMTQCGSPYWMAPEMIQNLSYDEKSDVYSFGICLWEIYTRQIPYRDTGLNAGNVVIRVVRDTLRPTIPSTMPKPYYRLMERCWHSDPNKRPSFKQIVRVLESFQDDPVISTHVPFDPRASQQAAEARERAKQRFSEETEQVQNIFKDGWLLENPARDITLDCVTANERHDALVEIYKRSNARRFNESAMDPYPYFGQYPSIPTDSVAVDMSAPLGDPPTEHTVLPGKPARPYVLTRHVGAVLPEHQTQLMLYAIFPKDMHYAKLRSNYTCVRVLHLTALARDPSETKTEPIPCYALERYGSSAKFLKSSRLGSDPAINEKAKSFLQSLSNLRHPNIVLYMGGYVMTDYVGVATERMHQGILTPLLDLQHIIFEWNFVLSILTDIAKGLQYLFSLPTPIIPNNFGPDMVHVDRNWRCKLSAVDIFPTLDEYIYGTSPAMPVPPTAYTAPEFIENFTLKPKHTMEAAVYSLGVMINQLFAREKPYNGVVDAKTLRRIVKKHQRPKQPSLMPTELAELVKRCWSANPQERPNIQTVLECLERQKELGPPRTELHEGVDGVRRYHKQATVVAFFSRDPVTVYKDWGKNEVEGGGFVIRSNEGDVYAVEGKVFRRSYVPVVGGEDEYRKLGTVLGRQMLDPFVVKMSKGLVAHGQAGDFLVQDAYGEQWVIDGNLFFRMYSEDYSQEDLDADVRARRAALEESGAYVPCPSGTLTPVIEEEEEEEEKEGKGEKEKPELTITPDVVFEVQEEEKKKKIKKKKRDKKLKRSSVETEGLGTRRARTRQDVLMEKAVSEHESRNAAPATPILIDPPLRTLVEPIPHYTGTGEDLVADSERGDETDKYDDTPLYGPVLTQRPPSTSTSVSASISTLYPAPVPSPAPTSSPLAIPARTPLENPIRPPLEIPRPSAVSVTGSTVTPRSLYLAQLQVPGGSANSSGLLAGEQLRRSSGVVSPSFSDMLQGMSSPIPVAVSSGPRPATTPMVFPKVASPAPMASGSTPTPFRNAASADLLGVAPGSMASLMSLRRRSLNNLEGSQNNTAPTKSSQSGNLHNVQMSILNKT